MREGRRPGAAAHAPRRGLRLRAAALVILAAAGPLRAKDVTHLWYAGGTLAFHSTQDTIDNNADLPGDPRPNDIVTQRMGVQDTGSLNATVGFNLTRRGSLQLDVGWFRGRIGTIDVFLEDSFPRSLDPSRPEVLNGSGHREMTIPVTAGRLTEIPVSLTGFLRFRQDRPINPYIGAGAGMIFTGVDGAGDLEDLNSRMASMRITGVSNERGVDLVPQNTSPLDRSEGRIPFTHPVSVRSTDGFEWHVVAGMEYFIGGRASLVADVRYTFAVADVTVDLEGQDQIDLAIWSEKLFRPDGSLKIFDASGGLPNPRINTADPSSPRVTCKANTVGDFDHDGRGGDLCYTNNPSLPGDDPRGVFLVQGGTLKLSGYNVQVGMRFYF